MIKLFTRFKWLTIPTGIFFFELATSWGRAYNLFIDVPISFTKYLLLVLFVVGKKWLTRVQTLIWFTLSLLGVYVLGAVVDKHLPDSAAPNILVSFLGIWAGYIISNKKTAIGIKVLIPIAVSVFSVWYISGGYNNWFNFASDGTFTGKVKEPMPQGWYTYTKSNDTLGTDFYKDKIVFLDFWNTGCVVCFKKFPDTERLYQKYKHKKNFIVQAVNIPMKRDTAGMALNMFEKRGKYHFPVVMGNEMMRAKFEIEAYPTVIILKNNKIIFRGSIELVEKVLEDEPGLK